MEGVVEVLAIIQIALLLLISVPFLYWLIMRIFAREESHEILSELPDSMICVVLPMRNEISNVARKLSSVVSEILPYEQAKLVIADSNSNDGTGEIAVDFLKKSELDESRWQVMSFARKGKNVALNGVLEKVEADIFIISDADANVCPGWLDVVRSRLGDSEIGVVSGVENVDSGGLGKLNSYYRSKSNWLRVQESRKDSTPVLEGSLLAWKTKSLGPLKILEDTNADDAQIGFWAIRRGFRSIVDPRISFEGFENRDRTAAESIRRSQGLSIALYRNADLVFRATRKKSRGATFNAAFLYLVFPWILLLFTINSILAFIIVPGIANSWETYSIASMLMVAILPQGRSIIYGAMISIIAHSQIAMGKRYGNWDPLR